MINILFSADHHFNHENIIRYSKRPFKTIGEMNNELISRWNEKVKPDDIVFYVGDFAFVKTKKELEELFKKLNGLIILIKGNHDLKKKDVLNHLTISLNGNLVCLAHKPEDCFERINIHGHTHSKEKIFRTKKNKVFINVGVDAWNYYPVSLNEIKKLLNLKEAR